jgi:hypothetical protein
MGFELSATLRLVNIQGAEDARPKIDDGETANRRPRSWETSRTAPRAALVVIAA